MEVKKKITIKDVAKQAGVAISTVSNAMNGSKLVTEETRVKILEIADQMGYVPNVNGKLLKAGKSKRFCFITSTVKGGYFCKIMDAMNLACVKSGYGLDIVITWDRTEIMKHIMGRQFDGYFIFEGKHIWEEDLRTVEKEQIPMVMIDRKIQKEYIGSVVFDSYKMGAEITELLVKKGHRHFCFVECTADTYDSEERKKGFLEVLKKNEIPDKNIVLLNGFFDENVTYAEVMSLYSRYQITHEQMPTAFVCGNDKSAIGAMRALQQIGYQIPKEISVVGFDNIELGEYFNPTLTTVKNPIENQGYEAVQMMIDMVEKEKKAKIVILEGAIIERKSSGE